jgi:hypothetical protein
MFFLSSIIMCCGLSFLVKYFMFIKLSCKNGGSVIVIYRGHTNPAVLPKLFHTAGTVVFDGGEEKE